MRTLLALFLLLAATTPASAGNEDLWPLLHDVLGAQRELPCKEVWTHSDSTTYVMKLDKTGRVLERANSRGGDRKRYGYDARGRIVSIDGDDNLLGGFAIKVRYGKRGIERLTQLRTPVAGSRRKASTFELIWRYPKAGTVRISVAIDGKEKATDVLHYRKGKLTSMELSVGEVMTAAYDASGRLTTMTRTYEGKSSRLTTFSYDDKGRLVREVLDSDADGVVDQTHEYSYSCNGK